MTSTLSCPTLQGLPPQGARLCLAVEAFVREMLGREAEGRRVVIAFSGGADSLALAAVLACLAPRLQWTLCCAHLDHGLRPESADEAAMAVEACARLGLACAVRRVDVAALARERGLGIEDAGRKARREFFEDLRREVGADMVALGHQLNDLAEDVVMRLVRGAGWPALSGMAAWKPDRAVLRPLLLTPRAEIEAFLNALGWAWVTDPSNQDQAFFRNRVRRDILPLLDRENPNFLLAVAGLWRLGRLDAELFRGLTGPVDLRPVSDAGPDAAGAAFALGSRDPVPDSGPDPCPESGDREIFLPAQALGLPAALRLRLYKQALEKLGPGQPLLDGLLRLDRAWVGHRLGRVFQFPGRKEVRVQREGLRFSTQGDD